MEKWQKKTDQALEKKAEASEKQGEKKDENKTSGKDDKKTEKHMMKPCGWTKKRKKLLSLWKKGKRKLHKAALHKAALLPNRKVLLPVRQNLTQNIAGKRKSQKERSSRKKKQAEEQQKKTTKLPGSCGEGWALGKRAKSTKKEREAG